MTSQLKAIRLILAALALTMICFSVPAADSSVDISADLTDHYHRMMRYHERMDGNVPEGAVLFIGDSITQGLCVAAVSERGVNYGIGSDTTVGVAHRLPRYTSIARASAVVLAIGVNDLRRRDNEAILERMAQLIETISGQAPLVVSAVLPLDERVSSIDAGRNERIAALNRGVAALCAQQAGCVFVDVSATLSDAQGNLAEEHHVGDGVHLNTAGYALWIDALRDAIASTRGAQTDGSPDNRQ